MSHAQAYFYVVICIRLWYSNRLNSLVQHDSLWAVIEKIARQENYSNSNLLLLWLLIDTIDIAHEGTKAREHFALFLQNGNQTMKLACLSRLKSVLKEQKDERTFIEWAFNMLVSQISFDSKVTEMVTDILYNNTKKPLNLNIVVKHLVSNPQLVPPLTRLDSARSFIYRIISTSDGFALFKNNSNYIASEFKFFVVRSRSLFYNSSSRTSTAMLPIWRTGWRFESCSCPTPFSRRPLCSKTPRSKSRLSRSSRPPTSCSAI